MIVTIARLRDAALVTRGTYRILRRRQPEIRAVGFAREPVPVTDLDHERKRSQCPHTAQAPNLRTTPVNSEFAATSSIA